jgi:TPR repeat protein
LETANALNSQGLGFGSLAPAFSAGPRANLSDRGGNHRLADAIGPEGRVVHFARLSIFFYLLGVFGAVQAHAEPPADDFKFPGCEWRAVSGSAKPVLFCPNRKGKMWRLSFYAEFDQGTLARARAGDPHAIGIVGSEYINAWDFPLRDVKRGEALLRKASDAGDIRATRQLANWLSLSVGADVGDKTIRPEAVRLWKIAAESGDAESMDHLGSAYEFGQGVTQDVAESIRWYREAAQTGYVPAMLELCSLFGYFNPASAIDPVESARWCRAAAEAGDQAGMSGLAYDFEQGKGVPKDAGEAKRWRDKSKAATIADLLDQVNKLGIDRALYAERQLGDEYFNGQDVAKDVEEGIRWYEKAATAGDRDAAEHLFSYYSDFGPTPRSPDPAKAAFWKQRINAIAFDDLVDGAQRGNRADMTRLATLELTGKDPMRSSLVASLDAADGARWMRKAAEAGDTDAMYRLGVLYAGGVGVPKDAVESKRWLDKAAAADPVQYASVETLLQGIEKKDPAEMLLISGRLLREGRQDEAVFWYFEAELRARADILAHPCPQAEFCADGAWDIFVVLGEPIKQYAGGDIPKFAATIDKVIAWDEAHPGPDSDAAAHEKVRAEYKKLHDNLLAKKDEIRAARAKQGLPNSTP